MLTTASPAKTGEFPVAGEDSGRSANTATLAETSRVRQGDKLNPYLLPALIVVTKVTCGTLVVAELTTRPSSGDTETTNWLTILMRTRVC
jgi:hypothetical protein